MKKFLHSWLFLIIGLSLILTTWAYCLDYLGIIIWPDINSIRLYENPVYRLGMPEFIELFHPYSRLWDASLWPIFIYFIIRQGYLAHQAANSWILAIVLLITTIASQMLASNIFAIYASLAWITVVFLFFNDRSALFLALLTGFIFGLTFIGLIYGFILALTLYVIAVVLNYIIK